MTYPYWIRNPDGPFATLIRVAATYCHPEVGEGAYDALKRLAKRGNDEEMTAFKRELQEAILDPDSIPEDDLDYEVQYDDGSADRFLRRLWRDLYPGEPAPSRS